MPSPDLHARGFASPHSARALERAFALLADGDAACRTRLRGAVWAYVDDSRSRGDTPERVIIAIKEIARRADIVSSRVSVLTGKPFTDGDAVMQDAIRWCIERYFAGDRSRLRA